ALQLGVETYEGLAGYSPKAPTTGKIRRASEGLLTTAKELDCADLVDVPLSHKHKLVARHLGGLVRPLLRLSVGHFEDLRGLGRRFGFPAARGIRFFCSGFFEDH